MQAELENMIEKLERDKESIFLVLNENVSQTLLALKLLLGEVQYAEDKRTEIIDTCGKYLEFAIDDLRNLSSLFWPYSLYHSRFSDTIRSLAFGIIRERSVSVTWQLEYDWDENISLTKRLIICQILEEQLKSILSCSLVADIIIGFRVEGRYIILSIADHIDPLYARAPAYSHKLRAIKEKIEIFKGKLFVTFQVGLGNLLIVHLPI
jgi:glucose-6-phosphate-specific signal transduction histidine kinase